MQDYIAFTLSVNVKSENMSFIYQLDRVQAGPKMCVLGVCVGFLLISVTVSVKLLQNTQSGFI